MRQIKRIFLSLALCFLTSCSAVTISFNDDVSYGETSNATIDEDTRTDQKDEVALYLNTYGHLPSNYMTKKEAREKGWEHGSLSSVLEGYSIGGDYYGNYEGVLPEDNEYHECDIDTEDKTSRGAKRIVYSEDGDIWYTEDHYEHFELLYGDGN